MKYRNIISYLLILFGGSIAIYANALERQNILLLLLGIGALMFGLFRLSASLPSNLPKDDFKINDEEE